MAREREELAEVWAEIDRMALGVTELGRSLGLPLTAASSNLASPLPMRDAAARPYAETVFDWVKTEQPYWRNRRLALNQPILNAVRLTAEPFYFDGERLLSWRPNTLLATVDVGRARQDYGVASALVAPVHLPFGILGAVVWANAEPINALAEIFTRSAERLLAVAARFIGAHAEVSCISTPAEAPPTPREVQCLRWAAMGKTDNEIAEILQISVPTVRFHLKNAAAKLDAVSRSHAVYRATALGYVTAAH